MRQYKRSLEVIVGDDEQEVSIRDLLIQIEIKQEAHFKPAEGFVKIYNLNETNETRIRNQFTRIRVVGGYEGSESLLFDGDIRKVERDREGINRVTVITLGGNVFRLTNAEFNRSYEGVVTVRQIIADAIPSLQLPSDSLNIIPDSAALYDFAWSGRTVDLMERVLSPLDIQWFEDNGLIKFSLQGEPENRIVFDINRQSGMIASPSVTDNDGVKVKSLLNPRLRVNSLVRIRSDILDFPAQGDATSARAGEATGFYKITKVVHRGDNRRGEYVSEIIGASVTEVS